eukprot:6176053-Pleurochrysis_carterae.AAC.1
MSIFVAAAVAATASGCSTPASPAGADCVAEDLAELASLRVQHREIDEKMKEARVDLNVARVQAAADRQALTLKLRESELRHRRYCQAVASSLTDLEGAC